MARWRCDRWGSKGSRSSTSRTPASSASSALHLGRGRRSPPARTTSSSASGPEKLTQTTRPKGDGGDRHGVDLERQAELDASEDRLRQRAGRSRARSFFMDLYADMTRRYMAASGGDAGGLRPGRRQESAQRQPQPARPVRQRADHPAGAGQPRGRCPADAADVLADRRRRRRGRADERGGAARRAAGASRVASVVRSGNRHDAHDPRAGSTRGRCAGRPPTSWPGSARRTSTAPRSTTPAPRPS